MSYLHLIIPVLVVFPSIHGYADESSKESMSAEELVQWPSGRGICTGPILYNQYQACRDTSHGIESYNKKAQAPCPIKSQYSYSDESCPTTYKTCLVAVNYVARGAFLDVENCSNNCAPENRCNDPTRMAAILSNRGLPLGTKIRWMSEQPHRAESFERHVDDNKLLKIGHYETTCKYEIQDPILAQKEDKSCGVASVEKCKAKIVYSLCADEAFGIDSYNLKRTEACNPELDGTGELKVFTAPPGQNIEDLTKNPAVIDASCSTCEDIPLSDVNERAQCLIQVMESKQGTYSNAVIAKVIAGMRVFRSYISEKQITADPALIKKMDGYLKNL